MSGAVATRTSMETIEAERREFWLELHIADRASRRFHDFLQLAAGKGDFRERELCCNAATTPATPPMLCVGQTCLQVGRLAKERPWQQVGAVQKRIGHETSTSNLRIPAAGQAVE